MTIHRTHGADLVEFSISHYGYTPFSNNRCTTRHDLPNTWSLITILGCSLLCAYFLQTRLLLDSQRDIGVEQMLWHRMWESGGLAQTRSAVDQIRPSKRAPGPLGRGAKFVLGEFVAAWAWFFRTESFALTSPQRSHERSHTNSRT